MKKDISGSVEYCKGKFNDAPKSIFKKVFDCLINIFAHIYIIFIYSLIFPLTIGFLIFIFFPIIMKFNNWFIGFHWYIQWSIYVIMGFCIKKWGRKWLTNLKLWWRKGRFEEANKKY